MSFGISELVHINCIRIYTLERGLDMSRAEEGVYHVWILALIALVAVIVFAILNRDDELIGTQEHLNGCVVNYGVNEGPAFLRLEGNDCRGGSIEVASSSTDVRPTVVMEDDEGEITLERDNFPDGTVYHFSVSYVDENDATTTQPFYAIQEGDGKNVSDDD